MSNPLEMDSEPTSHILCLPLELRYEIYSYLLPAESILWPGKRSPNVPVKNFGLPLSLLLTNHQLSTEACHWFHRTAVFRFFAIGSTSMLDEGKAVAEMVPSALSCLRQMRNVELVLCWNLDGERSRTGRDCWPKWMTTWLDELVDVFVREAWGLEVVIVSLKDPSTKARWTMKKPLLEPLRRLKGRVQFRVGSLITSKEQGNEVLQGVTEFVRELDS